MAKIQQIRKAKVKPQGGETVEAVIGANADIYDNDHISLGRKANTAIGAFSVAAGKNVEANNEWAHAEGEDTTASGPGSHSEGYRTKAIQEYSHAEGVSTTASGYGSHASGLGTEAKGNYQTAIGKYNKPDTDLLFIIGNGNATTRSNIVTVDASGTTINGKLTAKEANITGNTEVNGKLIANSAEIGVSLTASSATINNLNVPSKLKIKDSSGTYLTVNPVTASKNITGTPTKDSSDLFTAGGAYNLNTNINTKLNSNDIIVYRLTLKMDNLTPSDKKGLYYYDYSNTNYNKDTHICISTSGCVELNGTDYPCATSVRYYSSKWRIYFFPHHSGSTIIDMGAPATVNLVFIHK